MVGNTIPRSGMGASASGLPISNAFAEGREWLVWERVFHQRMEFGQESGRFRAGVVKMASRTA